MGCDVSDRDGEELLSQPSSTTAKRFKLPRKQLFEDCNGVDHASVPRKLRSAMKKRNRESVSPPFPDSKKFNHGNGVVESSKRDGAKRSKLNMRQGGPGWSQKQSVCGPITKDEEEVVETLYALAGMFPYNKSDYESKLDRASEDASFPVSLEAIESFPRLLEDSVATKEKLNSTCFSTEPEPADATTVVQRLPEETMVKVNSPNEPSAQEHLQSASEKNNVEIDSFVAQVDRTILGKHEERKPLCNSINFYVPPEVYQDTSKLKQPIKLENSLIGRKPDIALGLMTTERQVDQQNMSNESIRNGPTLLPGLSSTMSSGAWSHGLSSQHPSDRIPTWLDIALSNSRPNSVQNGFSTGKVLKVNSDKRSWKRCAAHMYISRLIQAMKMPERKENLSLHQNQQKPSEICKQGTLMTVNDFIGVRIGLNGFKSASGIAIDTKKNSKESINGTLPLQRLHQDQPQAALASAMYTSQKQSFDFLSLSAGGGGCETNTSFSGSGNGLEPPLPRLQVPYMHSHLQYTTFMPSSVSQTRYTSSSCPDQASASSAQQAQLQLPAYLGNPFNGSHASPTTWTKQKQQQQLLQQQQQHRLWASQMAVQYRTAATSTALAHFPSFQNGMQDSSTLMPCAQAVIPPSSASVDVLGPKYQQLPQQQQLTNITSLPHPRVKKQDHHLSSIYDETGGGFHSGTALPLQLLCNERL